MKTVMAAVYFSPVADRVVLEAMRVVRGVLARSPCPVVVPVEATGSARPAAKAKRK